MRKQYQKQEIDTSQPAVPDTVSVATLPRESPTTRQWFDVEEVLTGTGKVVVQYRKAREAYS
ncbi:MAG: hypothetical protein ACRDPW_05450 [Mycobacteriales bacterium]